MAELSKKTSKNCEKFGEQMEHLFDFQLTMEDFTIIQNALHYYKHSEKRGHFKQYDIERCEKLRDKLSYQLIPSVNSKRGI
jgi:hypothetical protein